MSPSLLLSLYALLLDLAFYLSLPFSPFSESGQLSRRAGERGVWVLCNTRPSTLTTFKDDGTTGFFVHSCVWYGGTDTDGPVKVEIAINIDVAPLLSDMGLHLRILNLPTSESGKESPMQGNREIFKTGTTTMTNNDLFDFSKMEGFLTTEFFDDANYRVGESSAWDINDCNTYVRRLLAAMNMGLPERLTNILAGSDRWQGVQRNLNVDIKYVGYLSDGNRKPQVISLQSEEGCEGGSRMKREACSLTFDDEGEKGPGTFHDELALYDEYRNIPSDMTDLSDDDSLVKTPAGGMSMDVETKSMLARVGSDLKILTVIDKEALNTLGIAGTIVGASFVILDFINHDWVGGAIGAVGLIAGIGAGALVAGSLGWIIGGAIIALFGILSGLFLNANQPAARTDVQGIIQWKMFGDASHIGNEQCQKGTADVPGNPNYTAIYGSGTLSSVLGLNNFDSIAFLIQYNRGYPMSIPDIAAAWFVIDPTVENSGSDEIATISCNNKKCVEASKAGCMGGDPPLLCNHPTFAINRDLITLPNLNATASEIYNKVIPDPDGDCKLIAYPGTQYFKTYNLSFTGLPSAIACGLSTSSNTDEVSLPVGIGTTNITSTNNTSTDRQGGAYVPAPSASPFATLSNNDYVCLSYSGASRYLPPGIYQKQSGLGFEIKNVDTLTLLSGGYEFQTYWEDAPIARDPRPQGHTVNKYTTNQSPPSKSSTFYGFAADMQTIDQNRDGQARFTIFGPSTGTDPICCLYSATSLGGDAWCGGIGGEPLPMQWQNQAQSAKCFNGGNMWIYAQSYGDEGGAVIKGEADDLSSVPYGDTQNFSKQVKSVWILKGS